MQDEEKERQASAVHHQQKAAAAQKQAEAAERQAVAADKTATASLIRLKAELLDRVIKHKEMGIPVPPELLGMLKE